ncbi:UBN2 domain-containing protein, partial [Cephalotus follicularis]
LNAKAKHIIICAINSNEFNRVSSCVSAKDIWDRLEVTYEGTNQVKEAKINMLVHEYEMFTMRDNEDIKTMFTRFTNITNALQDLAIEEAKDLRTLPLEDLLGSLMTHELSIIKKDDEEEMERKNEKIVALKSSANEGIEEDSGQEMALIMRRF